MMYDPDLYRTMYGTDRHIRARRRVWPVLAVIALFLLAAWLEGRPM